VSAALQSDINAEVEAMFKEGVDLQEAIGLLLSYWSGKQMAGGGSASITTNSTRLQRSFPMSDSKKGLYDIGGSKFRSKFDAASGHWQLHHSACL